MELTMQDLKMENEVNLCISCCDQYPECITDKNDVDIIFGTGAGDDNIAACNKYEAITFKSPR